MRHAAEKVLLGVIGCVSQVVFRASRGRVVLYRFHGTPGVLLTVSGPDAPEGTTLGVSYLPDGDDYIVLAAGTKDWTALRTATHATVELASDQHVSVGITVLTDDAERAAIFERILRCASLDERHEVVRRREFPVARLTSHHQPAFDSSEAFAVIQRS